MNESSNPFRNLTLSTPARCKIVMWKGFLQGCHVVSSLPGAQTKKIENLSPFPKPEVVNWQPLVLRDIAIGTLSKSEVVMRRAFLHGSHVVLQVRRVSDVLGVVVAAGRITLDTLGCAESRSKEQETDRKGFGKHSETNNISDLMNSAFLSSSLLFWNAAERYINFLAALHIALQLWKSWTLEYRYTK